jgi:hypothetical protein
LESRGQRTLKTGGNYQVVRLVVGNDQYCVLFQSYFLAAQPIDSGGYDAFRRPVIPLLASTSVYAYSLYNIKLYGIT